MQAAYLAAQAVGLDPAGGLCLVGGLEREAEPLVVGLFECVRGRGEESRGRRYGQMGNGA